MFIPEQIFAQIEQIPAEDNGYCLLFSGKDILLDPAGDLPRISTVKPLLELADRPTLFAGTWNGSACISAEIPVLPDDLPAGVQRLPARSLLLSEDTGIWDLLSRAKKLILWRRQHTYCGKCRAPLVPSTRDMSVFCPECAVRYFPQIAPAIIVAVRKGNALLLAHNRNFEQDVYSLIAGFVEAGETVEHAVAREVAEETGVQIRNIRYLSSQAWPFPNSLMLAFEAEYESGTPTPDGVEIEKLGWFDAGHLPTLPRHGSIARKVIDRIFSK